MCCLQIIWFNFTIDREILPSHIVHTINPSATTKKASRNSTCPTKATYQPPIKFCFPCIIVRPPQDGPKKTSRLPRPLPNTPQDCPRPSQGCSRLSQDHQRPLDVAIFYARNLILVNLILVNLFGFLVMKSSPEVIRGATWWKFFLQTSRSFLNQNCWNQTVGKPTFRGQHLGVLSSAAECFFNIIIAMDMYTNHCSLNKKEKGESWALFRTFLIVFFK